MLRNFFSTFALATILGLTFLGTAEPATAATVGITSSGALGAIDTYDWGQLQPANTSLTSPQTVTSAGGATATVSSAGNELVELPQGFGNGEWHGNFTTGTNVLWAPPANTDITIS